MTAPATDLTEADLGPLGPMIASGGQARIYELPNLTLPDVRGPLVYKKYKQGKGPMHSIRPIVALRSDLVAEPAKLSFLDSLTAWPIRQVSDANGAVLGLVLARIPGPFFEDLRLPSGAVDNTPREIQYLFIRPDKAMRLHLPTPTPNERLSVCRDFAGALAFLHDELRVAFGDINPRNAVFRVNAEPTVMLIDCDAVRKIGQSSAMPQLNAPDWDPPEGTGTLGVPTDLYKLGLFVLRCLTPGDFSSINRDPRPAASVLDQRGMGLLNKALLGDPVERPSAQQWHRYLRRALGEALSPPVLTKVTLDRTIVAAGESATLTWAADEADVLELTGPGLPRPISVSAAAGSGSVAVQPVRTGRITVTVRNQLGSDETLTDPVFVYDVASFEDIPVPMPLFDPLRVLPRHLPSVTAVLPSMPGGAPVPLPAMALASWDQPDPVSQQFVDVVGPPPAAASGVPDIPTDITALMTAPPDPDPKAKR